MSRIGLEISLWNFHFTALLPKMGLSDKLFVSAAPYRNARESKGGGCQVDLLIQTRKTAYVVEIKRKREIGSEVCDEVARYIGSLALCDGKGTSRVGGLRNSGRRVRCELRILRDLWYNSVCKK